MLWGVRSIDSFGKCFWKFHLNHLDAYKGIELIFKFLGYIPIVHKVHPNEILQTGLAYAFLR